MNSSFDNNLTEPMKQLVNRVESFTEKPIVFGVEDTLAIPAKVSMARGNKPNHVISIGPQYKHDMDAIQYLVAHECCHILRRFGVEPQERLVIQKTGKMKYIAISEMRDDYLSSPMGAKHINLPDIEIRLMGILANEYESMVRAVFTRTQDLPVEKWICDEYPELLDSQIKVLEEELEMLVEIPIEKRMFRRFFVASKAMDYAFFKVAATWMGLDGDAIIRPFLKYSDVRSKGEELVLITKNNPLGNYEDDIRLVDEWARLLKIRHWFEFVPFSEAADDDAGDLYL
ncbi:MAG: hypothetical protein L6427_03490 [Actinomycetia bacterium]|nr:hypothetical protein [Actinomycetes bacterium]